MELIAVDIVAIEIGAAFLAVIVIAAVAFFVHVRLLERAVQRSQADLRAQRAQAVAATPVVANERPVARLRITTNQERWVETSEAPAAEHTADEPSAKRPARPRSAAR